MRPSSRPRSSCARGCAGFELPDDTLQWLLRRFPRDMATLYELLDTLDEAALVAQRRLTIPFIREVLSAVRRAGLRRGARRGRDAPPERLGERLLLCAEGRALACHR